ncbi:hypothetical protein Tco_1521904 [Tanacetum coccineum]
MLSVCLRRDLRCLLEDHIFAKCCIAVDTWKDVLLWWHTPGITVTSIEDVLSLADRVPLESKFHQYFHVVVGTTVWYLWSYRNKVTFSQKRPRKDLILNDIKLSAFTWISSRKKNVSPRWLEWLCNPCNSVFPVHRDWHSAVLLSKRRGYFVLLYLEVFASSQTGDEDACDEPMKRD